MSPSSDSDIPETDFSGGVRGRFYRPNAALVAPVRLEPAVLEALLVRAAAEGVSLEVLVNQLLKRDMEALA